MNDDHEERIAEFERRVAIREGMSWIHTITLLAMAVAVLILATQS